MPRKLKPLRCIACNKNKRQTIEPNTVYTRNLDYCDKCIHKLEKEFEQIRYTAEQQLQGASPDELEGIANDILSECKRVMREFKIKDSFQLEDILTNS